MKPCRAKILATLGPASSSNDKIRALLEAGADAFRLNFSHGTHDQHKERLEAIRKIAKDMKRPVGIVADLQGPKLRVGTFEGGSVILEDGQKFHLDMDSTPGNKDRVSLMHPEIFAALKEGTPLLLNDGLIRLKVLSFTENTAETLVEVGGVLSDRKGVNVPSVVLPIAAITEKDKKDLIAALEMDVDWIALSFVQRPDDILQARALIGDKAGIIAKLEKPSALDHLDEIVRLTDAVMVARGDLGVEMPAEVVPILQKRIVKACREVGKPVVVATQMLESMIHAPTPTRAEASDVATAIYDGADAVMLSAETAAGKYPVESVSMMEKIISRVEADSFGRRIMDVYRHPAGHTTPDAISEAACQIAQTIGAAAIVTFTMSGSTTLRAARERPTVPILSLSPSLKLAQRLALVWGVYSSITPNVDSFNEIERKAIRHAMKKGIAEEGEELVVTAGVPFGAGGETNILRVARVRPVPKGSTARV